MATSTPSTRALGAVTAATLLIAACGRDDDSASDLDDVTTIDPSGVTVEATTTAADPTATLPAECPPAVPFDMEFRSDGDGERDTMTVVDAVALRRADGVAMTVYLADFDMPDDTSWAFSVPDVPPGGTLVQTGLDVFNADPATLPELETGASGGLFGEVGAGVTATFLTIVSGGSTSTNQTGESELLYIDDSAVCLRAGIISESGDELVGVYSAPIVADI